MVIKPIRENVARYAGGMVQQLSGDVYALILELPSMLKAMPSRSKLFYLGDVICPVKVLVVDDFWFFRRRC